MSGGRQLVFPSKTPLPQTVPLLLSSVRVWLLPRLVPVPGALVARPVPFLVDRSPYLSFLPQILLLPFAVRFDFPYSFSLGSKKSYIVTNMRGSLLTFLQTVTTSSWIGFNRDGRPGCVCITVLFYRCLSRAACFTQVMSLSECGYGSPPPVEQVLFAFTLNKYYAQECLLPPFASIFKVGCTYQPGCGVRSIYSLIPLLFSSWEKKRRTVIFFFSGYPTPYHLIVPMCPSPITLFKLFSDEFWRVYPRINPDPDHLSPGLASFQTSVVSIHLKSPHISSSWFFFPPSQFL